MVDADLVLASGLNLEPYLDRLVANSGLRGRVIAVGDALPLVLSAPGFPGEKDPHWWHSIGNMLFAVDLVRSEFSPRASRMSGDLRPRTRAPMGCASGP